MIKKVIYSGDKYFFESPEFDYGINIIVGDNGSGKSTFSYFVEYCLGGNIKPFVDGKEGGKYKEILDDNNNYVELQLVINQEEFGLKRFINDNEIFISEKGEVEKLPVNRNKDYAPRIFSDWLLEKLEITPFELSLGSITWVFNFNDLYRLLCYDQDTEPRRIFKSPSTESFVSDSSIIRKSTFEALLGISSIDYFKKLDELREAERNKDQARIGATGFESLHPNLNKNTEELKKIIHEYSEELDKTTDERDLYQKTNTKVDEKTEHLTTIQSELIDLEIKISDDSVRTKEYQAEANKITRYREELVLEISEITKTIFAHEKLNLFSMEVCPFCMSKKSKSEGVCICGETFKEDNYEKFVYNTSEYKNILKHKEKSLVTITIALNSYNEKIETLDENIEKNSKKANVLKQKLHTVINAIEYSGNSQLIDSLNDKIIELKNEILLSKHQLDLTIEKERLSKELEKQEKQLKKVKKEYATLKYKFDNDNEKTIEEFNGIYNELMKKSSYKSQAAEIDEEYMPYIDGGVYKNKSADVPKRLMYYFTILSLSLKLDTVKHPRFLLIDTPETVGIDDDNLNHDLSLLKIAIELSKKDESSKVPLYQVLLTTGEDKYPKEYEEFVKLELSEENENYILKEKLSKEVTDKKY